jgi:hypothetical protein
LYEFFYGFLQFLRKQRIEIVFPYGLVLKPRKCKSLSIKAGCSAAEEFKLGDYTMASIRDDPYIQFLGAYITYKGKGVPGLIKGKMESWLENIDKCLVRDERKVRIGERR